MVTPTYPMRPFRMYYARDGTGEKALSHRHDRAQGDVGAGLFSTWLADLDLSRVALVDGARVPQLCDWVCDLMVVVGDVVGPGCSVVSLFPEYVV